MNVIYTDMELGNLCALEHLSHKYKDRSDEFIIVARNPGIFTQANKCEKAVRKMFPNCLFGFQGVFDITEYCQSIKRVYGMSNLDYIASELMKIGRCSQIFVLMGTVEGKDGWHNDPNAEQNKEAYGYIIENITGYGFQVTLTETQQRFDTLRYNGIAKLEYFKEYSKLNGGYCPELQFILIVESKQGFMFHLFANNEFVRKDTTKKVLLQDRINRYNEYFHMYKQRCQVYQGICHALERIQYDFEYVKLNSAEQLRINIATYMFMYTNGLNKENRILASERLLDSWGLQTFTPYVDWILTHIDDFMYVKKTTSIEELKTILWMGTHYSSQEMPAFVFKSIAAFKATGLFPSIQGRVMTLEEYAEWEDKIYKVKDFPSELLYRTLFILMRTEVSCCNDVKENGRNIFTKDFAREHVNDLEHNVIKAYQAMFGTGKSAVFGGI